MCTGTWWYVCGEGRAVLHRTVLIPSWHRYSILFAFLYRVGLTFGSSEVLFAAVKGASLKFVLFSFVSKSAVLRLNFNCFLFSQLRDEMAYFERHNT